MFTHARGAANRLFRKIGFLAGRSVSQFQVMCGDHRLGSALSDPAAWYLRAGDLDPESCRWSVSASPKVFTDPNYRSAIRDPRPIKRVPLLASSAASPRGPIRP
jgi:hypothetical protein